MTPDERRSQIVSLIAGGSPSGPADLAARFGVSEDSIRRDLRLLAERGLVRRVHGGALPHGPLAPLGERTAQDPLAQRRLAAAAAERLTGFRTVCLDGGPTVLEAARLLPPGFAATIVTVSLPVAAELAPRPGMQVILLGGLVSGVSMATVGPEVLSALNQYRFDACLLGVCRLDATAGLTAPDRDEAFVQGAMVARSERVIAVASRTKLQTAEAFVVAPAQAVDLLITDAEPTDPAVEALRRAGVEIACVPGE